MFIYSHIEYDFHVAYGTTLPVPKQSSLGKVKYCTICANDK